MQHQPPAIVIIDEAAADVVVFAVELVVDRGDAPRVAVRCPIPGRVDVVNVEDAGRDDAGSTDNGQRRVRFLVEAERDAAAYDVRVIVSLGEVEQTLAGPHIGARR